MQLDKVFYEEEKKIRLLSRIAGAIACHSAHKLFIRVNAFSWREYKW